MNMEMTRNYTLKKRAEQQAMTRQRIVEAAVDLHGTVGPALTTVTMVAERAGVQRHTFYAHFPEERDLLLACSSFVAERDPLPDAEPWRTIAEVGERLKVGIAALYGWYERNAGLAACVLRDAEHHALTREVVELRMGGPMAAFRAVLGQGLNARQSALLDVALTFFTWRSLARDSKLKQDQAVAVMVEAITGLT